MLAIPVPPALMQGGPPVQPPDMPTLSAMPGGAADASAGMPQPGQVGALPKIFFGVEQQLQLLAKVVPPDLVADIDAIAQNLRAVLVKSLQSGAGALGPQGLTMPGQPSNIAGPVGPRPESGMQFP